MTACTWKLKLEVRTPSYGPGSRHLAFLTRRKRDVKEVKAKSLPIHGVAHGANTRIRLWRGKFDITVASLDDRKFHVGMNFLIG